MKVIGPFGNPESTLNIPGLVPVDYESGFTFFIDRTYFSIIHYINTYITGYGGHPLPHYGDGLLKQDLVHLLEQLPQVHAGQQRL